jgi:hypothetical protein
MGHKANAHRLFGIAANLIEAAISDPGQRAENSAEKENNRQDLSIATRGLADTK